jgi:hypothetical protein
MTAAIALALGLLFLAGCESDNYNEWQRVVCEVELVNGGAPLVSAYIDVGGDGAIGGTDDSFPIDAVSVLFRARPYNLSTMTIPENDAHSWFHITNYDLVWVPGPGAPAGLTAFNVTRGAFDLIVPVNEDAESSVMIADRALKEAYTAGLVNNGAADFTATARLRFYGHESGGNHEVAIDAGVHVTFTGAITTN